MKVLIKNKSKFPKCVQSFKELKGICIGKCIDKFSEIPTEHYAHAHSVNGDSHQGWICLKYKFQLKEKYTLLHEVAHLMANKLCSVPIHGKKWRKAVIEIGGTYKSYHTYNKKLVYQDFSHSSPQR
jgi:hypothetical protein